MISDIFTIPSPQGKELLRLVTWIFRKATGEKQFPPEANKFWYLHSASRRGRV